MNESSPPVTHAEMANAIRFLSADAVQKANSGHPGMPMGMADVATVLFSQFMKFDVADPRWPDRDRFILSAGHGSMLLYSLMYLTGSEDMTIEQIQNFRQLGSITAGHPEYGHASAAETTTGPLGQGLANSVGMALSERMLAARFGSDVVDHFTYVIAGDGCLMEGISHEAISLAGHLKLSKLIVLFDDNKISIDGPTDLTVSDDQCARFEASGWDTATVDGHDPEVVAAAIEQARQSNKPSLIACRTTIGYGAPTLAGTSKTHGAPLGDEEIAGARAALGWSAEPFDIPEATLASWRSIGGQGSKARAAWQDVLGALPADRKADFERTMSGALPQGWESAIATVKTRAVKDAPKMATRKASEEVLKELTKVIPEMVGGSADLTGSNNTKVDALRPISSDDFSGGYVYWGVREHGMASAMNGMALHGGFIPFAGTFLVFTDYCRPAIRLSALMKQRVIYVMTHDSIGLGEDGPTHQPVEHLASLRAMPNVMVMRPADLVETAECWGIAIAQADRPSVLALSRQGLPTVRLTDTAENLCAKGGYVLSETDGPRQATILATGSEVSLALEAQETLKSEGISAAVVSMPCCDLFDEQGDAHRASVLGTAPRVAVEAGICYGWERYVGDNGHIVGMSSFGASAPASDLYTHFGITSDAVVSAVKARI
ncbi:MAG: transketolase [Rhodospirillaceae bacterium]|jgi:transketolase|nr:transketolase [Rhodospirillaceae bacterium]MBT6088901.1 transketolase [Rhodospirillaceae bacterium]MBT6959636.1 transketolase [Rhodospirillaceae bacterium]MBT7449739.1 transketolase [Rhodospirillaceae bacterium]